MQIDSYMPVKVICGKDCLLNKGSLISSLGKKCIIITGKSSAVISGALEDAKKVLNECNIEYIVFNGIEPNPETATCKKAGDKAVKFNADFVLGIGGGSVLDASKAIAIYALHPEFEHADIYNRPVPSSHLPVVLVGITAGTGSEVTGVSVLTHSDTRLKKSISGADCYADISFCDFSYSASTDIETRISTALDAFCHAFESYVAESANDLSQLYALKALSIVGRYFIDGRIAASLNQEDYEKLYIASLYAGLAINISGTCFPHTVGYYLTENFNVPHGKACAVFVGDLIERTKKYCPHKLEAISECIGTDIQVLEAAIKKHSSIDVSVSETELTEICKRWEAPVRNFDRTPGGYCAEDAFRNLRRLLSK